ncbi:hypothetical protein HXA34_20185 [Salipaludibacillus agaradhaerens]|jgi:hypothetical protein|uniref:hypothetical protein n=1 Tax=Salipaludibacillus agaradhaerens TaxID=76935 RepID=UPI002151E49B|nr:hypothetical protein [Salipaludibacillus agaradhaerens]MCR6108612.1 hypothetical protein [Salipaludibacillus agaradhaerens]MCR6120640.1 hypothetical protein [Salipaludibacillus agaradhaerens]
MKTKKEIKERIDATVSTLKKYHEAYHQKKIAFDVMSDKVNECHAIIDTLKWVLGENDRHD